MARFDDGKEQGALRTIGEVAEALGIKQHVLRYWEQQFPMLQPLKRSGGRRYYRTHDIALVEAIHRLVNHEGYTLKGAKKALSQNGTMTESVTHEPETGASGRETESQVPLLAATPGFPLVSDLPDDGGVEAFFGSPARDAGAVPEVAPQMVGEPGEESAPPAAPQNEPGTARVDNSELVAALKAIRGRLAVALAA